jgi:hypothetical protein
MNAIHYDLRESERRRKTVWAFLFSWPSLIMLAWLLYEVNSQASLIVVLLCLKYGWEDFKTARWLRWRDPNRSRGRTCFWLFVASGFWKITIRSWILMLVGPLLHAFFAGPGNGAANARDLPPFFMERAIAAMIGLLLCTITTSIGIIRALLLGQRIWVDSEVSRAREGNWWPPPDGPSERVNTAGRLIVSSLLAVVLPPTVVCIAFWAGANRNVGEDDAIRQALIILLITLGTIPVGLLIVRDWFARRLFAKAPSKCWVAER